MASWEDVAAVVTALPDVEETRPRQWRVGGKAFVFERPLRRADLDALGDAAPTGDVLGARVPDLAAKAALIAEQPDVFFTTPHFDGYATVLARLPGLAHDDLVELAVEAWLTCASRAAGQAWLAEHPDGRP